MARERLHLSIWGKLKLLFHSSQAYLEASFWGHYTTVVSNMVSWKYLGIHMQGPWYLNYIVRICFW